MERGNGGGRRGNDGRVEPGSDAEGGACRFSSFKLLKRKDSACTDDGLGNAAADCRDGGGRGRGAERHLQNGQPSRHERARKRNGLLFILNYNDGNDSRFAKSFYHVHNCVLYQSMSLRCTRLVNTAIAVLTDLGS